MTDIVERLRGLADCDARAGEPLGKCMREAADEIERLREKLDWMDEVVRTSRSAALEEAAKFIEANCECDAIWHAKQIRALKGGA
jgi:hypothetical protein